MLFSNRKEAGQQLAGRLAAFADRADAIVISLVPGGVPIGFEIARNLHIDFDIFPIFKFYSPYNNDFAFGACSLNDLSYIDKQLQERFAVHESRIKFLKIEAKHELAKLNAIYRNGKSSTNLEDKTVIIVDDGTICEDDIFYATKLILQQDPKSVIIAAPLISSSMNDLFDENIENVICLAELSNEMNVANCYQDFSIVSDHEVNLLLECTNNKLVH